MIEHLCSAYCNGWDVVVAQLVTLSSLRKDSKFGCRTVCSGGGEGGGGNSGGSGQGFGKPGARGTVGRRRLGQPEQPVDFGRLPAGR